MDDDRPAGPGRRRRVDRGVHLRRRAAGRLGRATTSWSCPTAAAYQHPERVVLRAAEWFEPAGRPGRGPHGGRPGRRPRTRAWRPWSAAPASSTSPAGRPSTCESVLKGSATFEALREAWNGGRRGGRLGRRRHGADRPDGRPPRRRPDGRPRPGRPAGRRAPLRRRATRTPTARSCSARWPWPRPGCRWWASPTAPRSSGTGDGTWRYEGGGASRWSSSTARRPTGSAALQG